MHVKLPVAGLGWLAAHASSHFLQHFGAREDDVLSLVLQRRCGLRRFRRGLFPLSFGALCSWSFWRPSPITSVPFPVAASLGVGVSAATVTLAALGGLAVGYSRGTRSCSALRRSVSRGCAPGCHVGGRIISRPRHAGLPGARRRPPDRDLVTSSAATVHVHLLGPCARRLALHLIVALIVKVMPVIVAVAVTTAIRMHGGIDLVARAGVVTVLAAPATAAAAPVVDSALLAAALVAAAAVTTFLTFVSAALGPTLSSTRLLGVIACVAPATRALPAGQERPFHQFFLAWREHRRSEHFEPPPVGRLQFCDHDGIFLRVDTCMCRRRQCCRFDCLLLIRWSGEGVHRDPGRVAQFREELPGLGGEVLFRVLCRAHHHLLPVRCVSLH